MTVLELFSGGGGAALGLHRAGFCALAHLEWDADACATLRAAVEAGRLDGEVVQADISTADLSPWAGVDALWSSFPCQCWSLAGKRLGAKDERNGWPWTVRAIDAVRPRWLMCENVPGLTMHDGDCNGGSPDWCPACYFHQVILPDLRARFAHVQWAELNASSYGTPQHRRRIYIVAGPRPVPWPEPTHAHPSECHGLFGRLRPWVSVRQALGSSVVQHLQSGVGHTPTTERGSPRSTEEPAPTLGGKTAMYAATRAASEPWRLDQPAPAVTTCEAKGTRGEHISRELPSGARAGGVDRASDALWLATGRRQITLREALILMGWPEDWPLQGTQTAGYRQAGNGCAPQVVEALGRALLKVDRGC